MRSIKQRKPDKLILRTAALRHCGSKFFVLITRTAALRHCGSKFFMVDISWAGYSANIDNTFITEYKQSSPRSSGRYNIPYPVSVVDFSVKEGLPFQTTCYCRVELRSDIPGSLRVFPQPAIATYFCSAK